jgi:hypothetical protein
MGYCILKWDTSGSRMIVTPTHFLGSALTMVTVWKVWLLDQHWPLAGDNHR